MSVATNFILPRPGAIPPTMTPFVPQFGMPRAAPVSPPTIPSFTQSAGQVTRASASRRARQVATATNNSQGAQGNPPPQRLQLTREQTRLLTLTDAEIVRYFLAIGDIQQPPTVSEPAVKALFYDLSIACFNGRRADGRPAKTEIEINALRGILTRAGQFREAMSQSRDAVRKELKASGENDAMAFLPKAVEECTNSVRKELYNDKPYPAIRIAPETLLKKVRTLRDRDIYVRSQFPVQSPQAKEERQRKYDIQLQQQQRAAQAEQAEQAAIAATSSFYANCNNSKIAGSQNVPTSPHAPTDAACLSGGSLTWRNLEELLRYAVRARKIDWTVTPRNHSPFPHPSLTRSVWATVKYSDVPTKVITHFAADLREIVLLGPRTYSTDDGRTWQNNPYPTSAALQAIKAAASDALIAKAAGRPHGSGCQFPPAIGGR
jgi:hypothetical protein